MTRQGANGATREEIDRVFHWTAAITPAAHRALQQALQPGKEKDGRGRDAKEVLAYELHVANALWAQQGLAVERPFTSALAAEFGAPLQRLDFTDQKAARAAINRWVAGHTRDRILDIVPEGLPAPDTLLALANAIWFKAAWQDPFEERWTKPAPFTTADGRTPEVPLMHRVGSYRYFGDDEVQVCELPYRGGKTSMLVVLPKQSDGLPALEAKLSGERIDGWIAGLAHADVAVKLPRFQVTWATDLVEVLKQLGMPTAFDASKADFTGMTKAAPLLIGAVLHKAWVQVDEAGTEAAAATVVMMLEGGMPRKPIEFTADHPFVFLIRHQETGAILFAGRYAGPAK
jgi:serpin B